MLNPAGVLSLLLLAPPLAAPDRVDEFVLAEMARQKVPGVGVAIVEKGAVVKLKGYGLANVEHQVPVKPETIFQSGSLGKQFTAAVVMLLVEGGKLGLEDPVTRLLPDAPETWRSIRVRHLLTHTSGIPDYTTDALDYRKDYTEDELLHLAYGLKPEFSAGARWNYSNTGYVVLGILVRKASGSFYGDLLRDSVFGPLGMKTARVISEPDIVPNRAAGYRLEKGELRNQEWVAPQLNTTADGSLYFSLLDLIAWDRGLRAGVLLKAESWARVFEPVRLSSGKSYPYGFGWAMEEAGGQKVVQHGGAWQGFKTYLARYLGDDRTVVVLANLAQADPERIAGGVAAVLNPKLARPELRPIPDTEPSLTSRLRELLAKTAAGQLSPDEFAYVRAGFFPDAAKRYEELLEPLGPPTRVDLLEQKELGDDRVCQFDVAYGQKAFRVRIAVAPDGKLAAFGVSPR